MPSSLSYPANSWKTALPTARPKPSPGWRPIIPTLLCKVLGSAVQLRSPIEKQQLLVSLQTKLKTGDEILKTPFLKILPW